MLCPCAIGQDNGTQSASPAKKSIAIGSATNLVAPKMVLPKSTHVRLSRTAKRKITAAYPSNHYQKAMYFKQKNDKSRALVEFLKATQENPRLVKAYYEQALIFREKNYLKLAQSSLDQAIAIKPDYQEARMLLATVQIQQGNVGAAMKQLGQSLGLKVGTEDGADKSSPSVTVLQSLHSLMPENVSKTVMRVAKTNNQVSEKSISKRQNSNKSESKNKSDQLLDEQTQADSFSSADSSTSSTPPVSKSAPEGEIAFAGLHFQNPLHRFWSGMKNSDAQTTQGSNNKSDFVDSGELSANVSEKRDKIVVRKSSNKAAKNASEAIFTRHTNGGGDDTNAVDTNAADNNVSATSTGNSNVTDANAGDTNTGNASSNAHTDVTPVGPPPTTNLTDTDVANLDINHLPNLPAANSDESQKVRPLSSQNDAATEHSQENKNKDGANRPQSEREQATKPKKSWLSHFIPSFDEDQDLTPPAPPPTSLVNRAVSTAITAGNSATKQGLTPEVNSVVPTQVETFDKPDESRAFLEKVSNMAQGAANNLSNMAKNGFQLPNLPNPNLNLFNSLGTNSNTTAPEQQVAQTPDAPKVYKPVKAPNSDDPWSVRLRYLADHGTGTLKEGEAFMFSEETGEATLFLADGQTVHRAIYLPRDAQEVVKQRRPDILTPDELLYNLSLLAKLMPKSNDQQQQQNAQPQPTSGQSIGTPAIQQPSQSNFEAKDLMGKSQNFWGWLKGRFENLVPN